MDALVQDLRFAVRALRRARGTAVMAIATLAIGIAATTTMFSVVYATLLRPLPFPDADRLVMLYLRQPPSSTGPSERRWPLAKIVSVKDSARSYDSLATYTTTDGVSVTGEGGAEQLETEIVSAAYFQVLRVLPGGGRVFLAEEDTPGHRVVIVSESVWRRQLGGEAFAPGRTLLVNAVPLTVVGLLPDAFRGLSGRAQLWIPIGMAPELTYRDYLTTPQHFINLIGRLSPGVTLAQANAELALIGPRLPRVGAAAEDESWIPVARALDTARIDPLLKRSALMLFLAVGCLLLVTSINVAALLLIRARLRRQEIGIRVAIGAGRGRIVRQLLTEAGVLAACGGAGGVLLAAWGIAAFRRLSPDMLGPTHTGYQQLAAFASPALDGVALLWTLLLALGCTFVCGLAPALITLGSNPARIVTQATRSSTASGQGRALRVLAAAQVALAVLLVAGALMLVASFLRLQQTRVGFEPSGVLVFWISPPASRYAPEAGPSVIERILQRIQSLPGVSLAAVNRCTPFSSSCSRTTAFFPGRPTAATQAPAVGRHYVSADYFRTLGMRLVGGRALTDGDRAGRPPVAVINETAANRFWPGEDPIGKHVWFGSGTGFMDPANSVEIVGVVEDVKYWPLNEPPGPDFYTSYLQFAYPNTAVIVRSESDPAAVVPAIRTTVADVDRTIPVHDVRLLDDRVAEALSRPRFNALSMAAFAVITVLLAAMGIFGAVSAGVTSRTRELAIRLALGATSTGLRRLVLAEGLLLAGIGSAVGLGAAWIALRALGGALFGVTPTDPLLLGATTAIMVVVALLAASIPARRAAMTDPMVALRSE